MPATQKIPIEPLGSLGLHPGDTLHVLAVVDSSFLVRVSRDDSQAQHGQATDWLKSARGTVKLGKHETADDLRMEFYSKKYGLSQ